jgi:hypothetical protein
MDRVTNKLSQLAVDEPERTELGKVIVDVFDWSLSDNLRSDLELFINIITTLSPDPHEAFVHDYGTQFVNWLRAVRKTLPKLEEPIEMRRTPEGWYRNLYEMSKELNGFDVFFCVSCLPASDWEDDYDYQDGQFKWSKGRMVCWHYRDGCYALTVYMDK